jgi:hypothetical protein
MIVTVNATIALIPKRATGTSDGGWYYEVEAEDGPSVQDPGPEIIHSDGFYSTKDEAIDEGIAWAVQNGHVVHTP